MLAGGIIFLDTSDVYPLGGGLDTAGRTEQIVGRWLHGRRPEVILATKGFGATGARPWDRGNSRKHLLDAIEGSHECEFATVDAPQPLAKEAGMSLTRLAMAWVLANPAIRRRSSGPAGPSSSTTCCRRGDDAQRGSAGTARSAHARVPLGRRY